MKNAAVEGFEAEDIRRQVERVLKGLGNPDPPLCLDEVRELLSLDRHYYSSEDTDAVREFVSRLTVAGRQVLKRPTLIWDAIRKANLSALWLPDKKRILIDKSKPVLKHRWSEAHEMGHSIIPWHAKLNHGDTDFSLSLKCHATIEAEANYAAGQLLFLQDRFREEARELPRCIKTIKSLKGAFGNTLTSTLWRYVEDTHNDTPMVGVICGHPRHPSVDFNSSAPCKYFIQSAVFRRHFSYVSEIELFGAIKEYCGFQRGGMLGENEVILADDNDVPHVFHFETFFNRYEALTLGVHLRRHTKIAVAV